MKLKEMPKIKVRNPVALSPLLHKGGIHETEKPRAQHRRERQNSKQGEEADEGSRASEARDRLQRESPSEG